MSAGLGLAALAGPADAGDLSNALRFIEASTENPPIEGYEHLVPEREPSLHAFIEARDTPEGKALEEYDCFGDTRVDSFWTMTPDYIQNRNMARYCMETMWDRESLDGFVTLGRRRLLPREVAGWIADSAAETELAPILFDTIIRYSSGFRPDVVAEDGRVGLMQIHPHIARGYGATDPMNPEQNIRAGARYLRALLDKWESIEFALAEFRSSEAAIREADGIPSDKRVLWWVREVRNIHRIMTDPFPVEHGWEHVAFVATWLDAPTGQPDRNFYDPDGE